MDLSVRIYFTKMKIMMINVNVNVNVEKYAMIQILLHYPVRSRNVQNYSQVIFL